MEPVDELRPEPAARAPRGGVDAVLDHWRELDERAPLAEPVAPVAEPQAAGTPIDETVTAALEPGSLDRLAEMRIVSLEALVGTPALELARGLRTGYSRAARLQFLARRALAAVERADHEAPTAAGAAGGPFA